MPLTSDFTTPITAEQAYHLTALVRTSDRYQASPQIYTTLADDIDALVGVNSIASKHLAAIMVALDDLGDGTVGVRGGKYGADYSQSRDREQLLDEVLDALYSGIADGATVFVGGSWRLQNVPVW